MSNLLLYTVNEYNIAGNAAISGLCLEDALEHVVQSVLNAINEAIPEEGDEGRPITAVILNGNTMPVLGDDKKAAWTYLFERLSKEVSLVIVTIGKREMEGLGVETPTKVLEALEEYSKPFENVVTGNRFIDLEDFIICTMNLLPQQCDVNPWWVERNLTDELYDKNRLNRLSNDYCQVQQILINKYYEDFKEQHKKLDGRDSQVVYVSGYNLEPEEIKDIGEEANYLIMPFKTIVNPTRKGEKTLKHIKSSKLGGLNMRTILLIGKKSKEETAKCLV